MQAITPSQPPSAELTQPQPAGAQPDSQPGPDALSRTERISILVTVGLGVVSGALSVLFALDNQPIPLALSLGALGGLIHEMVQSGGKILFFERKLDGYYVGALAGMVLGSVAGLLTVRGLIADPDLAKNMFEVGYQTFLAGLALKGIVDAATGEPVPSGTKSVTTDQALAAERALSAPKPGGGLGVLTLPPPPARVPQD